MSKVNALVEGGKATAGPPLGPALGPLGVNIGEVIAKINEKTREFEGITVPVTVEIDAKKNISVEVGKPPTSQLILKELGKEKGSGDLQKVGNLAIEQAIKIAKQKLDDLKVHDLKTGVLQVVGTCQSMGVIFEGMEPKEAIEKIKAGNYDMAIKEERTQISQEKKEELKEELKEAKEEVKELMEEREAREAEIEEMLAPEAVEKEEVPEEEVPEGEKEEEPEEKQEEKQEAKE